MYISGKSFKYKFINNIFATSDIFREILNMQLKLIFAIFKYKGKSQEMFKGI